MKKASDYIRDLTHQNNEIQALNAKWRALLLKQEKDRQALLVAVDRATDETQPQTQENGDMSKELEERLKSAQRELDDAIMVVARCAQELSDDAHLNLDDQYEVETESLIELRNALAHWTKCTQAFLEAVDATNDVRLQS